MEDKSLLDAKGFRTVRIGKDRVVDESWYSVYVVWLIGIVGLFSVLFLNIFFKIIGIIVIIMALGILVQIAKQKRMNNHIKGVKGGKQDARRK